MIPQFELFGAKEPEEIFKGAPAVTVEQDGLPVLPNGVLDFSKPIEVSAKFSLMEKDGGSGGDFVAQPNDTVRILITDAGFEFFGTHAPTPLYTRTGELVGTVVFVSESDGGLYVDITFADPEETEDETIFDGNLIEVDCDIDASIKYSDSLAEDENKTVTIFQIEYKLPIPEKTTNYTISKEAATLSPAKNPDTIDWRVVITAKSTQGSVEEDASLAGLVFEDVLPDALQYVANTFKVDDAPVADTGEGLTVSGQTLRYVFAAETGEAVVTFQTEVDSTVYTALTLNGGSISNTAALTDGISVVQNSDPAEIIYEELTWITKTHANTTQGDTYDPAEARTTWQIEVNPNGRTLTNVAITEILDSDLEIVSATWQVGSGSASPIGHTDNVFTIPGAFNETGLLTVVTKIKEPETVTTGKTTYTNQASITGDFQGGGSIPGGAVSDQATSAIVGYDALTKSGTVNKASGTIDWEVTFEAKGQVMNDIKIYDLIVYGSSLADFDGLTVFDGAAPAPGISLSAINPPRVAFNQRYRVGTLAMTTGTATDIKIYTVKNDLGTPIADLIEVTIPNQTSGGTNTYAFAFTTDINPKLTSANSGQTLKNAAKLMFKDSDGGAKGRTAENTVTYPANMLKKGALNRSAWTSAGSVTSPNNTVGTSAAQRAAAYHYADDSVVYRLLVNANGLNLTDSSSKDYVQNITLTDTLPSGWVFEQIDGKDFLLYGTDGGGNATGVPLSATGIVTMGKNGNVATFAFAQLKQAYVILIKAAPTEAEKERIFSDNSGNAQILTNTASISYKYEDASTQSFSVGQDIRITSRILEKAVATYKVSDEGWLRWRVDYIPHGIDILPNPGDTLAIEDELPVGLELRTDSLGNLVLDQSDIELYELTINADGTVAPTGSSLISGDPDDPSQVSYNPQTRILKVTIPDQKKAYRLMYVTDVTADSTAGMENGVKLTAAGIDIEGIEDKVVTVSHNSSSTAKRGGSLEIFKKAAGSGLGLSGAAFKLCPQASPDYILRSGSTDAGGRLILRAIPVGKYILTETAAPGGYIELAYSYRVEVKEAPAGTFTTYVNDVPVALDTGLLITNHSEGSESALGKLHISKELVGTPISADEEFEFAITLPAAADNTYSYSGSKTGSLSFDASGSATVTLKADENVSIHDLPAGEPFTVAEAVPSGYAAYVKVGSGDQEKGECAEGFIPSDAAVNVQFTNKRTGDLTLSKTVMGNAGDPDKKFAFTVTIAQMGDDPISFTGEAPADAHFSAGSFTVELAHGESIAIHNVPHSAAYTIEEDDYSSDGYITSHTIGEGSVSGSSTDTQTFASGGAQVEFINAKYVGGLSIAKKLSGNAADEDKEFTFTVYVDGAAGKTYDVSVGEPVTFDGDGKATVKLKGGETIVIVGLPADAAFTVTESDYAAEGYATSYQIGSGPAVSGLAAAGSILREGAVSAIFTNSRSQDDPEPEPEIPTIPRKEVPDPEDPDSPDAFILEENGKKYTKTLTPDGYYLYLDEDGIPLGGPEAPKTGDRGHASLGITLALLFAATGAALLRKRRYPRTQR